MTAVAETGVARVEGAIVGREPEEAKAEGGQTAGAGSLGYPRSDVPLPCTWASGVDEPPWCIDMGRAEARAEETAEVDRW